MTSAHPHFLFCGEEPGWRPLRGDDAQRDHHRTLDQHINSWSSYQVIIGYVYSSGWGIGLMPPWGNERKVGRRTSRPAPMAFRR